jgi:hypothetical protein
MRRIGTFFAVGMAVAVGLAVGAHAQGAGSQAEKAPAPLASATNWYAPLKNIPAGPGKLDIGFNLRTRYEYRDNFDVRGYGTETDDHLLLLRTRLMFDYTFTDKAHAYLELQDARYWLSDLDRSLWPQNCPFYDAIELRQAYLEWKRIGGSPLGFKAGRQSISYADRHVFGPGEWGNVGRYWWDAAKLYVSTDPVQVDLLYGRRVISEPSHFNNDHFPYHMFGAYAQIKKQTWDDVSLKPDLFYIVQYDNHGKTVGESGKGDQQTHSCGFYFDGKYGDRWDFSGTLVGQAGEYGQDDIRACGYNAKAGYTWDMAWKPRLGGEFTYASGDSNTNDGEHATFDGVFGAVDLYYGRMNMLSWMNLEDYQVTVSVQPHKTLKLWADYHFFRLAEASDAWYWTSGRAARRDPTGQAGSDLGQEVDLLAQWQVNQNTEIFAGYSHFFPGEFVRNTSGSQDDADWFFLQATYKF